MNRCLLALAALMLLAACKQTIPEPIEAPLTDFVPSDAPLTITGNADAILKGAGCRVANSHLNLTADLKKLATRFMSEDEAAAINGIAASSHVADLSDCVVFTLGNRPGLFTIANIRDNADMPFAPKSFKTETFGMVKGWLSDSETAIILAADSLVWLLPYPDLEQAAVIIDSIAKAAAASPLHQSPLLTMPAGKSTITGRALLSQSVKNPIGDDFDAVVFSIALQDRLLTATLSCASQASGKSVDIASHCQPLGDMPLFALPAAPAFKMCAAIDRKGYRNLLGLIAPADFAQRMALSFISGALSPEGGTMAVAMIPGGSAETLRQMDMDNWLAAAKLPFGVSSSMMAVADKFDFITLEESPDSSFTLVYNFDPADYICDVDVTTDAKEGDFASIAVSIPYLSQIMKAIGIKNGYNINAVLKADKTVELNIKVNGTATYVFPALIADITKLTSN